MRRSAAEFSELGRFEIAGQDVHDLLALLAPFVPDVDVEIELRDPDDSPVIAGAVAGRAGAIVTGDRDLLDDPELRSWLDDRGIALYTPASLVQELS